MFEKNMGISYLLDFYGDVLDEHTHEVMTAYYDDDLSLAEVASLVGISRQGVRHIIKKGEEQLSFLEDRLGLASHYEELEEAASIIDGIKEALTEATVDKAEITSLLTKIQDIIVTR